MSDIVMPRLSDSMTEGTVVRWLKQPGEHVRRGEPLVEIETDKATITYESDIEGLLTQIVIGEGHTVPVGTQIALIHEQAAAPQQAPPPQQPPQQQPPQSNLPPLVAPGAAPPQALPTPPPEQQLPPLQPPPAQTGEYEVFDDSGVTAEHPPEPHYVTEEFPAEDEFTLPPYQQTDEHPVYTDEHEQYTDEHETGERVKASPIARRLARKLGVDIAAIAGSGPGGRVVKEDVEHAADHAAAAAAQATPTQATADFPAYAPPPAQSPTPSPEYAYEPGGSEIHEDDMFTVDTEPAPLPLPDVAPVGQQPQAPEQPPTPQAPDPPLIPNYPPPPPPQPQPGYGLPPGYPPPPQGFPQYAQPQPQPYPAGPPQPQQPFPGPPPFVSGMTGNYPAIQIPPEQQPQQQQQAPKQPGGTATRGHSTSVDPTSAQQTVARRMAESKATAPEFFVETDVDMTNAVSYRDQLRTALNPLPSFNDFVIKSCAQALRQYPKVNAAYKDGHFEEYSDVNIGVVVSATDLLAVPTLFNVDQKGLAQIAHESHELGEAVRNRTIQPAQLSGGTFSVSNLGMYGVDRFTAILNPPQAAILAVGAITRRAVIAEDGMSLVVRQIMTMTLTCDHRILYGAEAAEFLGAIKAWLESPQLLPV